MSYSFKKKLKILNKILKSYKKHLKNCSELIAFTEYDNVIIRNIGKFDYPKITKIPHDEIDKVIIRYRARLHKAKLKGLEQAILEDDIIELRETLKEVVK